MRLIHSGSKRVTTNNTKRQYHTNHTIHKICTYIQSIIHRNTYSPTLYKEFCCQNKNIQPCTQMSRWWGRGGGEGTQGYPNKLVHNIAGKGVF